MSRQFSKDISLEISSGRISNTSSVNKFGRAPQGVQTTKTDIWDRSDNVATQQIWTAPTTARTHNIKSTSASDTSAGVGARTLRIYGLTNWSSNEVSEDITLNGITNVLTVNSYVIIHRMKVLSKGSTNVNVGVITATATTDLTITAQINSGEGQTQMCIYGIPSTQTAYLTCYYVSMVEGTGFFGTSEDIKISLLLNPTPDVELTQFLIKQTQGINSSGSSHLNHCFKPYMKIVGPAIIKINCMGSANDLDVSAGFDLILENN